MHGHHHARRRGAFGRFFFVIGACVSLCGAALPAWADGPTSAQKETARGQMQLGDQSFAAGDFARALDAYRSADEIMRVPTTAWAVGRTYARLGKLVEAVDALQRAKLHPKTPGEPAVFAKARARAAELDADLAPRIPTVVISVRGATPTTAITIYVDGGAVERVAARLPQRVNPGAHVIEARADGYDAAMESIEVSEAERAAVELVLKKQSEKKGPGQSSSEEAPKSSDTVMIVAWTGFGVAGAGLVAGVVTGALSFTRAKDLEDRCPDGLCSEDLRSEQEDIITLANASNASFAIGGVGLAVGVGALVFAATSDDGSDAASEVRVEPVIGIGSLGLRGSF
jgi:tetratricopeptide (TPR) repeat protein